MRCSLNGWKEVSRRQLDLTTWNSRLEGNAWELSVVVVGGEVTEALTLAWFI